MSGKNRRSGLKTLAVVVFMLLLAAAGSLWWTGKAIFSQAVGLLGLDEDKYQVSSGLFFSLPLINIVWGRDISIIRQGRKGPAALHLASVYARRRSGREGPFWQVNIDGLDWGREEAWRATADKFSLRAAYQPNLREVSLREGNFENLQLFLGPADESGVSPASAGHADLSSLFELENYALTAGLDSFSFERLAFGAGLAGEPLEWNLQIKDLSLGPVRSTARAAGRSYEMRPFSLWFSGHAAAGDWALDLKIKRQEKKAELAEKSGLAALRAKAAESLDFKELLNFSGFSLEASGPWRTEGGDGAAQSRWSIDFPKLYQMELEGGSEAPGKNEVYAWAKGCLTRARGRGEDRPACLGAVAFDEMRIGYKDRKLVTILEKVGGLSRVLSLEKPKEMPLPDSEKYAIPLLGFSLARWLVENGYGAGLNSGFIFEKQGRALKPFTKPFRDELRDNTLEFDYSPLSATVISN